MTDIITSSGLPRISSGSRVTLHFAILLETGEEVDTTRRRSAAVFTVGDGSLLPGFEEALFGLQAGDDAQLLLARDRFSELELEPGLMVSFAAPDGELPGVVTRLFEKTVEVDFNHPLAGRPIIFDVSILAVEDGDPQNVPATS
jgi:FKBP-type peptidyl-prolyl cis-trans isomerase SlpA